MPDQILKCVDCPSSFTFTEAEQTFFLAKQFNAPKRCKACRTAKKARNDAAAAPAGAKVSKPPAPVEPRTFRPAPRLEVPMEVEQPRRERRNNRSHRRDRSDRYDD